MCNKIPVLSESSLTSVMSLSLAHLRAPLPTSIHGTTLHINNVN